uniref:Glutathione synthetase n=1 Tax=Oncorhynchus mykiss TaxID=8022 RepID=A0A8L0DKW7_ONCMY
MHSSHFSPHQDTFHQPLTVQTHYNRLVDKISQAGEPSSQVIQRAVMTKQKRLNGSLKQIEINTIAPGGCGVSAYYYFIISIFGHRYIENELWNSVHILTAKCFFCRQIPMGFLDENEALCVQMVVAIVYFRYGYIPQNYTERSWEARLMMERSLAVKCPDISTHLAGTKKVQQELGRPGVLERFFPGEPDVVDQIRATFAGLYTLDMKVTRLSMALAKPDQFVLKPQRGGGRAAYVWMDKIRPVHNYILERGTLLKLSTCICELCTFGAYVRYTHRQTCIFFHIVLRTKSDELSDGGVAAGVTVQDNPLFV